MFPSWSAMKGNDVTLRVNYVMIAEWRPSWISGLSQKLQESAKIERKVIKTTTKHCAGPLMIPRSEMILGNDATKN